MADIKNSAALDAMLEQAKQYGNKKTATAERLLALALEISLGDKASPEGCDFSFFTEYLENAGAVVEDVKDSLLEYIADETRNTFMDGILLQKCLITARNEAAAEGEEQLSPERLLRCILKSPPDALQWMLGVGQDTDGEEDEEQPEPGGTQPPEEPGADGDANGFSGRLSGTNEPKPAEETGAPSAKERVARLIARVKEIQETLLDTVYGQDNAVSVFTTGYFQAELLSLTDKNRSRPRATFLFAGPPGVGKTFLAEQAAKALKLPFMRFDMSEYSDKEANIEFCGSDQVYKNGKAGNVTGFAEAHPRCVLLFDEIEKAHINVIHLFLQMLDAGRLRDNFTDTEVSFTDAIIIFTTNAGKQLYEDPDTGSFSSLSRKVILRALNNDVNPATGIPYFPGAICSRFASGNVVMFNHISARGLRNIAKREILRHAANFEKEIGIGVEIDEDVYTALLFAQGGGADARMIRSRAESFFDDELFELFRLMASDKNNLDVGGLSSIHIGVDLAGNADKAVEALFSPVGNGTVLLFGAPAVSKRCREGATECRILCASDREQAAALIDKNDVSAVLLDLSPSGKKPQNYLNIEDVDSAARDFMRELLASRRDLPIYLLETEDFRLSPEERISFLRQGVCDTLCLNGESGFGEKLREILLGLHQQHSMSLLAKSNKLVSFGTAQTVSADGARAEIRLFDFRMSRAVEAEDARGMVSGATRPNVRFDRVIGAEGAKEELRYFVDYLKNPKRFAATGVKPPRGVLLYGPPGTGKTMLAKAMAGESDVAFFHAEGNQFLKKYVGEGPEAVHALFRAARKYAPSILFIDEIDAIAGERRGGEHAAASEETLTALLTEMDGFVSQTDRPVFVLAATNFDVEPGKDKSLDPALMRRFDRRIYIDLPDRDARLKYLKMKTVGAPFEISESKLENLAMRATGMSLAELESVLELSLRSCIRAGAVRVSDEVLDEAFETFNSGERTKWDIAGLERVARHEAGHAFLCWHGGETPSYLTVVARAGHGGYMQHADREDKRLFTKKELLANIRTALGGRAAEIVYYGEEDGVSTGAAGDLSSATGAARRMVCAYGMDDALGLAVIDRDESAIAGKVREAVNRILDGEMRKAVDLIAENRAAIDALVEVLLRKNHLSGQEINALFSSLAKK